MMTEFISYPDDMTVKAVIQDLSTRPDDYALYNVQYLYVLGKTGKLRGVLRLRDLVFGNPDLPVKKVMAPPEAVPVSTSMEDLGAYFDDHEMSAVPAVDEHNKMVGVVRRRAVYDALAEKAEEDNLKARGIVGGEELRSMPVLTRSGRRLSWLSVNVLLNILAASVIAAYQDTLSAAIALAVFLPIISDMSGCSGNQAVAVSMRELALGLVRPNELARVLAKEAGIGLLNGLVLGLMLGGAAWLWKGNPFLGLVVGGALALNTFVAVSFGGLIPLVLKRLKLDPALVSSPLLTTVTDMCGFFFVLSFASIMLERL